MMTEKLCPCGNSAQYQACCGKYIERNKLPPTPEALMRARYTAYALVKQEAKSADYKALQALCGKSWQGMFLGSQFIVVAQKQAV